MAKKHFSSPVARQPPARSANPDPGWKIENVVATAVMDLGSEEIRIDLNKVARKYSNTNYNPERFPGLVMRIGEPKATILMFTTGKMVITGMRDPVEARTIVEHVIGLLEKANIQIEPEPEIKIQNIVASGDLDVAIDLNEATILLENAIYEPEVFPGLIYRMQEPKTTFLIFSTGRIVCTGGKTREIVGRAIENLADEVESLGLSYKDSNDGSNETESP
ncbi:MAG: TATA-box-binding protein [Candidatus Hodarchaeota archaeon]